VELTLGDVYEALLTRDKPGQKPRAGLAKSVGRSADGKEWTFFLREGVRFHSGEPLKPADVVRSFELVRKAPGPLQTDFDDLRKVSVESEDTVVFRFFESRSSRIEAFASVPIVSKKSFRGVKAADLQRAEASRRPNGTGPLRFVSWDSGSIELTRFDRYWGRSARAKTIRYRVIPDRARVLAELRSGGLHVATRFPVDEALRAAADNDDLVLVQESLPAYTAAVFNTQVEGLDIDVRQALARSFDRESIVKELFHGYGEQAIGPYLRESENNEPSARPEAFSLKRTKKELGALWSDPKRGLRLLVPAGSRTMERLADIWAEDLRGIVSVEVIRLPFADMLARVRSGDFDLCLLSFTTSSEVDLYSLFHSSQVGSGNVARLEDPAVDLLVEGARKAQSAEEARDRGRELHRLLLNLAPFAFLTTDRRLGLVHAEVAGVGDSAQSSGARNLWRRQ
jgi:peptide/nickel transport system substrate-binding protein